MALIRGRNSSALRKTVAREFLVLLFTMVGISGLAARQLPSIPSKFDISDWIQKGIPAPGPSPQEGAFRFICNPSHDLPDDPIVYPGQPGRSHLHTFFGNTKANAHSTYTSLRTTGTGSCQGGPLNRSAYWMPSMMNGRGRIVRPDYISVYYKGTPQSRTLPRGLKMIFGYNMSDPSDRLGSNRDGWPEKPRWFCGSSSDYTNVIPGRCPASQQVNVQIASPQCWDGDNLDSENHRSHLRYKKYFSGGRYLCPATHPVEVPQFSLSVFYTQITNYEAKNWFLSSDRMPGMAELPRGHSFHTDWFGAWDDIIMDRWMTFCVRGMKNCSASDYGNRTAGIPPPKFEWKAHPRLVDPPTGSSPDAPVLPRGVMSSAQDDAPEHHAHGAKH